MASLVVLNSKYPKLRHVEMDDNFYLLALKQLEVDPSTVIDRYVGFIKEGLLFGVCHVSDNERPELIILHVDKAIMGSLFGATFEEEHGAWLDVKPYTIREMVGIFVLTTVKLRDTLGYVVPLKYKKLV